MGMPEQPGSALGVDPDAIGYVTLTLSQAGYEDKVVYEGPNPWAGEKITAVKI